MFITRRKFDEEISKALIEDQRRRFERERFDMLEKRIYEIENEIRELKMRIDPVYKAMNTPVRAYPPSECIPVNMEAKCCDG